MKPLKILAVMLLGTYGFSSASIFVNPIKNITPDIYKGGPQVWSIAKGADAYLFMAAGHELTVWDGVRWESYGAGYDKSGSLRIIRSVSYDHSSGRIYCSGDNFYGYWLINRFGDFDFTLLYTNENLSNGEIFWRTIPTSGGVYLQTHESVIWYNTNTALSTPILTDSEIGYMFDVGGSIYVQCDWRLFRIENKAVIPTEIVLDDRVVWIEQTGESDLILISENRGILIFKDGKLTSLNANTNTFLGGLRIFSACTMPGGNFLVGTVLDGAYIIDRKGEIKESFTDSKGLDFTTVLSVGIDSDSNIWLGLDGGIAYIPNNPNEKYYNSIHTKIGVVYASLIRGDDLYLGTNKGLFIVDKGRNVRFIANTQGQVWDIALCGNDIVVNHDRGLFRLTAAERLEPLMNGAWRIERWTGDPTLYHVADKSGFVIFKVADGRLVFRNRLEGYSGYKNYGQVDKYGNMWINGLDSKVRRLVLDRDKRRVESDKIYPFPKESNQWIGMTVLDGDVVFILEKSCYNYDPQSDAIVKSDYYTTLLALFESENLNIFQADNYFFHIGSRNISVVKREANGFTKVKNIFEQIGNNLPPLGFRQFQRIDDNIVSLGYGNGVAIYDISGEWYDRPDLIKLRKLEYSLYGESRFLPIPEDNSLLILPNGAANMRLFFTGGSTSHNLSYSIDGSDWQWMPSGEPLSFDYLASGRHILRIRSDAPDSPECRLVISIERHFTATIPFMLILLAVLGLLFWIGVVLYDKRVSTLKKRYQKRQEEAIERERIDHENAMLSLELRESNKQLATFAIHDVGINTMLDDIDSQITNILQPKAESTKILVNVRSIIKKHKRSNGNWKLFESYFDGAYDGFLSKLTAHYPHLTNNDIRMCVLIKLGMSTKEIAAFLNIEVASAESARYRLRKNMGLAQSDSLSRLINQI